MTLNFHRTLVRVVGTQKDGVWLCVPGWNSAVAVLRSFSAIPSDFQPFLKHGKRFFAKVTIGAESANELDFSDFEYPTV